jgi:hypothetical protein
MDFMAADSRNGGEDEGQELSKAYLREVQGHKAQRQGYGDLRKPQA